MYTTSYIFCTWHRLVVMVLKPAEESVHCGEYLRTVAETIWSDGHILHPADEGKERKNMLKEHVFNLKHLQGNCGTEPKKFPSFWPLSKAKPFPDINSCHLNQLFVHESDFYPTFLRAASPHRQHVLLTGVCHEADNQVGTSLAGLCRRRRSKEWKSASLFLSWPAAPPFSTWEEKHHQIVAGWE